MIIILGKVNVILICFFSFVSEFDDWWIIQYLYVYNKIL